MCAQETVAPTTVPRTAPARTSEAQCRSETIRSRPVAVATIAARERASGEPARSALLASASKRIGSSQRGVEGAFSRNSRKIRLVARPPTTPASTGPILFQRAGQLSSEACCSAAATAPEASETTMAAHTPRASRFRVIARLQGQEACHGSASRTSVLSNPSHATLQDKRDAKRITSQSNGRNDTALTSAIADPGSRAVRVFGFVGLPIGPPVLSARGALLVFVVDAVRASALDGVDLVVRRRPAGDHPVAVIDAVRVPALDGVDLVVRRRPAGDHPVAVIDAVRVPGLGSIDLCVRRRVCHLAGFVGAGRHGSGTGATGSGSGE